MPRNRKKKQAFRKANTGDVIPISNTNLTSHTSNATCRRCNRELGDCFFKSGRLCHFCIRLERKKRNEQFFKPEGLMPYKKPTGVIQSSKIDYSERNDLSDHQTSTSREVWDRRVYPTPPHMLNKFDNHNRRADNFYPSIQNHQAIHLEPRYIHQDLSSFHPDGHTHYSSIVETCSPQYTNAGRKRKQNTESTSSKKFKPISYPIPSSNNHLLTSSSFHQQELVSKTHGAPASYTREGFQIRQEDILSRSASLSIPSVNTAEKFSMLSENIWNYFVENKQTDEIYEAKMALRAEIQRIIQTHFKSDLFVFGSSMTGFATKTSDVDMCLMFHGQKVQRKKTIKILWNLQRIFYDYNFKKLEVIPAKVPIIKFHDRINGFDVDLNINNPTGIRNSQLLRSYARIDDRVRPLILAVKFWARFHKINDAKTNTLSSYSLGLMLIHFLQYRCCPPVLPPLQILQPDKYLPNSDVRILQVDEELPNYRSENNRNVGQLFAGFLNYYSKEYNYETSRISVRLGTILPRVELQLNKYNQLTYWIDIEEPFERINVARSTNNPDKSAYIKSVFDSSADLIDNNEIF